MLDSGKGRTANERECTRMGLWKLRGFWSFAGALRAMNRGIASSDVLAAPFMYSTHTDIPSTEPQRSSADMSLSKRPFASIRVHSRFISVPGTTVKVAISMVLLWLFLAAPVVADEEAGRGWGIASAHPLATEAGREVLEAGGNAFDVAVAVSAALGVVEPYGSGLGGGGFWLLHEAEGDRDVMIDGRERAPLAATRTMYQDEDGELIERASIDGPLAAGIPGLPAALVHIARDYGELPLARTLAPAIRLARDGYVIGESYRTMARFRRDVLQRSPAAADTFLVDGEVPPEGYRLRQPELAATLEHLARHGRSGFYDGPVARKLVAGVRDAGGIWSRRDLRAYRVRERTPITGHYRGMEVVSAAPPSSGGVTLVEALNILAPYDLGTVDPAERVHLVVEAMRRAYHDRARYLGDTDYVDVPAPH